jgi:hypothetical protein
MVGAAPVVAVPQGSEAKIWHVYGMVDILRETRRADVEYGELSLVSELLDAT